METDIINLLRSHDSSYIKINDETSLSNIHGLLINNILFEPIADVDFLYFGWYHYNITEDYITMEKYYKMAIDKGSGNSMNNFGLYHNNITKNYVEMEKYYQMAIDRENRVAMYNFGYYHQVITEDYVMMEKYYLMAINKGHDLAMNKLVKYYEDNMMYFKSLNLHISHSKNREKIIELFNCISALILNEEDIKQFLDLVSKFEFIPDDKLCASLKLFLNSKKDQLDTMDLHFTYTIHGKGYDSAKEDFLSKCLNKL